MAFCLLAIGVLLAGFNLFPEQLNQTQSPMYAITLCLLCIPFLVLAQTNSRVLQACRKVVSSLFALQLGVSMLMVIFVFALDYIGQQNINNLMTALLLASIGVAVISSANWLGSDQYQTSAFVPNKKNGRFCQASLLAVSSRMFFSGEALLLRAFLSQQRNSVC